MVDALDPLREENEWPRSYNLYSGKITFQIAAHSEEQALRRLKQLEEFLSGLVLDPEAEAESAHESVRYCIPAFEFGIEKPDYDIQFRETVTHESMPKGSMVSGELLEWSWLLPDADKDYDPSAAAHRIHFSEYVGDEE